MYVGVDGFVFEVNIVVLDNDNVFVGWFDVCYDIDGVFKLIGFGFNV